MPAPKQAGLNQPAGMPIPSGTVMVRAVVIATYFADDDVFSSSLTDADFTVKSIACDVLTYGGHRRSWLQKVGVMQPRHALNDHDLWMPRETTVDLSTGKAPVLPLSRFDAGGDGDVITDASAREAVGDPRNFDGDHVLVTFLDNDPQQPIVLPFQIPHPRATFTMDRANKERRRSRFRGVTTEIDKDGNVIVDTTGANDGAINTADPNIGEETVEDPRIDAHGNVTIRANHNAEVNLLGVKDGAGSEEKYRVRVKADELLVRLGDDTKLVVTDAAGDTFTAIGAADVSAMIHEHFAAWWDTVAVGVKAIFDLHVHPDGMGGTGPPPSPFPPTTAAAPSFKSTKLTFNDG